MGLKLEQTVYLTDESKQVLNEICDRCFYVSLKERKKFWKAVFGVANCTSLNDMTDDGFEAAYYKAKSLLLEQGKKVFKQHGQTSLVNLKFMYQSGTLKRWDKN